MKVVVVVPLPAVVLVLVMIVNEYKSVGVVALVSFLDVVLLHFVICRHAAVAVVVIDQLVQCQKKMKVHHQRYCSRHRHRPSLSIAVSFRDALELFGYQQDGLCPPPTATNNIYLPPTKRRTRRSESAPRCLSGQKSTQLEEWSLVIPS